MWKFRSLSIVGTVHGCYGREPAASWDIDVKGSEVATMLPPLPQSPNNHGSLDCWLELHSMAVTPQRKDRGRTKRPEAQGVKHLPTSYLTCFPADSQGRTLEVRPFHAFLPARNLRKPGSLGSGFCLRGKCRWQSASRYPKPGFTDVDDADIHGARVSPLTGSHARWACYPRSSATITMLIAISSSSVRSPGRPAAMRTCTASAL